jgi:hypothetical protein
VDSSGVRWITQAAGAAEDELSFDPLLDELESDLPESLLAESL